MGYEDIIRDIELGLTYDEISQKYHVSNSTISRIAKEHGLVKRAKRSVVENLANRIDVIEPDSLKVLVLPLIKEEIDKIDFRKIVPNYFLAAIRLMVSIVKKQYKRYMGKDTSIKFAVEYLENYMEGLT